jgi:hypothetical protein
MYKTLNQRIKERVEWVSRGFRGEHDWFDYAVDLERRNYLLVQNAGAELIRNGKRVKVLVRNSI